MAERYKGIRFNPESGIVEGFDNKKWLGDLQATLSVLARDFPHTRPNVVDAQVGEVGENKRFMPRPDEIFFKEGFSEGFYAAFEADQTVNLAARRRLNRHLTTLVPSFYIFTHLTASRDLVPVYRSETLSEVEGRIVMMHVEPTKVTTFHDGDAHEPASRERIKRYLQVLLPDFSSSENFFSCELEFGKEWLDEGGVVRRQQKKVFFPQSLPGGEEAPDMLHHLRSYDFRALWEVLADIYQFSDEQRDLIQGRWDEVQSVATVLQGHDKRNEQYSLPAVLMGAVHAADRPGIVDTKE